MTTIPDHPFEVEVTDRAAFVQHNAQHLAVMEGWARSNKKQGRL